MEALDREMRPDTDAGPSPETKDPPTFPCSSTLMNLGSDEGQSTESHFEDSMWGISKEEEAQEMRAFAQHSLGIEDWVLRAVPSSSLRGSLIPNSGAQTEVFQVHLVFSPKRHPTRVMLTVGKLIRIPNLTGPLGSLTYRLRK
jgi:hypothetical protein